MKYLSAALIIIITLLICLYLVIHLMESPVLYFFSGVTFFVTGIAIAEEIINKT